MPARDEATFPQEQRTLKKETGISEKGLTSQHSCFEEEGKRQKRN